MLTQREQKMIEKVRPTVEFEVQFVLDELSSTIQQQREEIKILNLRNASDTTESTKQSEAV